MLQKHLGVTCHFITEDRKIENLTLAALPPEERHTIAHMPGRGYYRIQHMVHYTGLIVSSSLKKASICKAFGFKRSELKEKQQQMYIPEHTLIKNVLFYGGETTGTVLAYHCHAL